MNDEKDNDSKNLVDKYADEKVKKLIKKKVIKTVLLILIPVLIAVIGALFVFSIFNKIGDVIQETISKLENLFTVDWDNGNGAITIDNDSIDQIIAAIEATGVDLADLKLLGDIDYSTVEKDSEEYKEILRKYIRKFYEAQVVTETLNTNPSWFEEHITNGGKVYGSVCVYRAQDLDVVDSNISGQLTYMNYEKMSEYATAGNINSIKKYFSVKDNKLVIPEWSITTVNGTTNNTVTLREIEYKSLISQYTTPMNFFMYLAMVSQNPEFVAEVTELVKGSKINLTILDTTTKSEEDEKYTYITHVKGSSVSYEPTGKVDVTGKPEIEKVVTPINESNNNEENTKTTVITVTPTIKVTYVKTWFCEQNITYNKKDITPYNDQYTLNASNDESLQDDPEPADPPEGSTVSWITDRKKDIKVNTSGTTYEEGVRGDVIDKTEDFIKLLDKKYKIPNTRRYEAAGKSNMVSGAEWLFSLMQKDSSLQNLEQVMRYILGKYAKKDYGVRSLDFNIFDAKDFSTVSGLGPLKAFIRHFEGTKEENGQYVVYKDTGGNRTVGYGVNIEAQKARFIARGIDPNTIKEGDKLDKELVDSIEEEIMSDMKSSVEAATSGMNLKSYQIIALVSRVYNCGNIKGFKDAYNKYWKESDDEYGVAENSSMYEHALYKNYMSMPVKDGKGNTLGGLVTRRKAEWILFKTGYNVATNSFIPEGGAIIECAQMIHQYMEQYNYIYCVKGSNSYEECSKLGRGAHYLSATFEGSKASEQTRKTCCATFVSWVLQEAGYITVADHSDSAGTLASILEKQKGFTRVLKTELEAGDIIVCDGHVEIYTGDGQVYNAGSGNAIRSASPSSKTNIYKCLYGLRAPK